MSWIDLVIAVVVVVAAVRGRSMGALRQFGRVLGLVTGFIVGAWAAPWLVARWHSNLWRPLTAVAILIACTFLGSAVGRAVGGWGNLSMRRLHLGALDASIGAAVGGVGAMVGCWLFAGILVSTPWTFIVGPIETSKFLAALDAVLPPVPTVESQMGELVRGANFPQVFSEVVAPRVTDVLVPSPSIAVRTAGVAARGVVPVRATGACDGTHLGTGFFVSPHDVVTAAHVVAGATTVTVQGRLAVVVAFDANRDLAVLWTGTPTSSWLSLDAAPSSGQAAAIVGYPTGGPERVQPAGVEGTIVATGPDLYNRARVTRSIVVLSAAVQPGNSGSPVVVHGRAVAVVISRLVSGATTYAVPATALAPVLATAHPPRSVSTGACVRGGR